MLSTARCFYPSDTILFKVLGVELDSSGDHHRYVLRATVAAKNCKARARRCFRSAEYKMGPKHDLSARTIRFANRHCKGARCPTFPLTLRICSACAVALCKCGMLGLCYRRWRMCTWCGWSPTMRGVHLVLRSRIPLGTAYAARRPQTRAPLASVWNGCVSHLLPLRAVPSLPEVLRQRPLAPLHMVAA